MAVNSVPNRRKSVRFLLGRSRDELNESTADSSRIRSALKGLSVQGRDTYIAEGSRPLEGPRSGGWRHMHSLYQVKLMAKRP